MYSISFARLAHDTFQNNISIKIGKNIQKINFNLYFNNQQFHGSGGIPTPLARWQSPRLPFHGQILDPPPRCIKINFGRQN